MSQEQAVDIVRQSLFLIIECAAPLLLASLVVGLVVSIFQTITSIQEQTLTFVPKILAVFICIMICGSWILTNVKDFIEKLWSDFSIYIR